MNIKRLERVIARVRNQATQTEQGGGTDGARGMRWAADEFETILNEWFYEALTPTQAAEECNWEASTIAKKLGDGSLVQAGVHGSPKVRRGDLFVSLTEPQGDLFVTLSETQLTELIGDVLSDALD